MIDKVINCNRQFGVSLGQHNDARMNISIALTATRLGATIANHVRVLDIVKERVS